jgi:hypothetical protein
MVAWATDRLVRLPRSFISIDHPLCEKRLLDSASEHSSVAADMYEPAGAGLVPGLEAGQIMRGLAIG